MAYLWSKHDPKEGGSRMPPPSFRRGRRPRSSIYFKIESTNRAPAYMLPIFWPLRPSLGLYFLYYPRTLPEPRFCIFFVYFHWSVHNFLVELAADWTAAWKTMQGGCPIAADLIKACSNFRRWRYECNFVFFQQFLTHYAMSVYWWRIKSVSHPCLFRTAL